MTTTPTTTTATARWTCGGKKLSKASDMGASHRPGKMHASGPSFPRGEWRVHWASIVPSFRTRRHAPCTWSTISCVFFGCGQVIWNISAYFGIIYSQNGRVEGCSTVDRRRYVLRLAVTFLESNAVLKLNVIRRVSTFVARRCPSRRNTCPEWEHLLRTRLVCCTGTPHALHQDSARSPADPTPPELCVHRSLCWSSA